MTQRVCHWCGSSCASDKDRAVSIKPLLYTWHNGSGSCASDNDRSVSIKTLLYTWHNGIRGHEAPHHHDTTGLSLVWISLCYFRPQGGVKALTVLRTARITSKRFVNRCGSFCVSWSRQLRRALIHTHARTHPPPPPHTHTHTHTPQNTYL